MSKRRKLCEVHTRWVPRWQSANQLDGLRRHLMLWEGTVPGQMLMFKTRKACREWINNRYGYIKHRDDLKKEPHGWRVPKAVKVFVTIQEVH
jgi:hypothetical protein